VACRLDIPWWEKLLGTSFKGGRCQLKQLSGGKMDDITVLIAYVEEVGARGTPAFPLAPCASSVSTTLKRNRNREVVPTI